MLNPLVAQSHIAIADARPRDYRGLMALVGDQGWHVHFLTRASAALKLATGGRIDAWFVNVELPDMSGWELMRQLRQRGSSPRIFLVADEYRVEQEQMACEAGVGLFLVKGTTRTLDCSTVLRDLCRDPCLKGEPIGES